MKKILTLLVLAFAIVSCTTGDEPKYSVNTNYVCYNCVQDNNDGSIALTAGNYEMTIDFTNLKIDARISVSLRSDLSPVVMSIKEIPMSFDETGGYKFNVANPTILGADGYNVTDLKGRVFAIYEEKDGMYIESFVYEISYTVNDRFDVCAISKDGTYYGKTTIINTISSDYNPFELKQAIFNVTLTDSRTATITFHDAKFAESMPPMTMKVVNVPIKLVKGGFNIEADRVVPQIDDTPFEQLAFNNFTMNISANGTAMNALYFCTFKGALHRVQTEAHIFPIEIK